ncbi:MAG: hypothetical protein LBV34_25520 [Nocardiopsaceae bacterium]|nr:hypothetical protein [Nocardiopsaceae bacterium]
MVSDGRDLYRVLIDELVRECRQGQGQIGPCRARTGTWNPNAEAAPDKFPDQRRINVLLTGLMQDDRDVLAQMLAEEFQGGVFTTLRVLHDHGVPPFEDGYEGTPFNDFVGRLDDWPWPT